MYILLSNKNSLYCSITSDHFLQLFPYVFMEHGTFSLFLQYAQKNQFVTYLQKLSAYLRIALQTKSSFTFPGCLGRKVQAEMIPVEPARVMPAKGETTNDSFIIPGELVADLKTQTNEQTHRRFT